VSKRLVEELEAVAPQGDTLVTIGVFDGVHLGHQRLLQRLLQRARERGVGSAALFFLQHPSTVLAPGTRVALITLPEERAALLRGTGVQHVQGISFTEDVSLLTARQFVELLLRHLRVKGLVVGPDFALGHKREGTVERLSVLGKDMGFTVEVVPPLTQSSTVVSSTAIRRALATGDVRGAARMLGRPFRLTGPVVRGEGRGRKLGFPTANIAFDPERALPADGVYATRAVIGGDAYDSATNVGLRPTFDGTKRTVEAYVMDFHRDIYGETVSLDFVDMLRTEERFSSVEALKEQIARDVQDARARLKALAAEKR